MTETEQIEAIACMVSNRPGPSKEAPAYRAVVAFQIRKDGGVPFGWWEMVSRYVVDWRGKTE
jgi:hypothetical protein